MENNQKWPDASPWHPIRDQKTLKVLGKLLEEVNELGTALARCIIQGVEECHPVTRKSNREWLLDEEADVIAGLRIMRRHLRVTDTEYDASAERISRKIAHLEQWHAYADSPPAAYQYEFGTWDSVAQDYIWETRLVPTLSPRILEEAAVPSGCVRNIVALRP